MYDTYDDPISYKYNINNDIIKILFDFLHHKHYISDYANEEGP